MDTVKLKFHPASQLMLDFLHIACSEMILVFEAEQND